MIFNNPGTRIMARVIFLFCLLLAFAFVIAGEYYLFAFLFLPLSIYIAYDLYRLVKKAEDEVNQFVESVHYRDFSRYFDVKHAPAELQPLRQGFNEINSTLKDISKEKETQYQYLQNILELVGTGILSYEMESGEILWMNETLKKLLQIPYLKTIQSLDRRDPDLCAKIVDLKWGENIVADITVDKNTMKILLSASAFQTEGKKYKLIAFQNVNEALDETESKAWQRLLRVMTHEIMNSIAPISSLSDTMKNMLSSEKHNVAEENMSMYEDLELGIDTIKRRSEGLLKFAETYRNLNKITSPNLHRFYARDLFENLHRLMQPTLQQKQIELEIILKDPELQLEADINLIEQVLINLLLNAIEAVKDNENKRIILAGSLNSYKRVIIKVADNGPGIEPDVLDKIFIPFFTTKKNGSGIGLSLCKQIMMLHKGNIQVQSKMQEGTAFTLIF